MYKLGYITIIFVLSTTFCRAQTFDGGLFFGANTSQVFGDGMAGFNKLGLYTGAFVSWPLTRKTFLQLELSYIEKGSRQKLREDDPTNTPYTLKTNYLEVPLLFGWKTDPFSLEFGLAASILVKGEDVDGVNNFDPSAQFSKTNLGFIFGGGYYLSKQLTINCRYSGSILAFRKLDHNEPSVLRIGGQYHTGLSFTLNYHFND
jgi:hypothetical protein